MMAIKRVPTAEMQLRSLSILLMIQFILGIALTTLIDYNPSKPSAIQTTFLVLHILVAAALLITAVVRLITSFLWGFLQAHSAAGLASIIGAMIAGTIASANGNNVAVFIMALGFLFAYGAYGYSLSALRNHKLERASTKRVK